MALLAVGVVLVAGCVEQTPSPAPTVVSVPPATTEASPAASPTPAVAAGARACAGPWVKDPKRTLFQGRQGLENLDKFDQLVGDPSVLYESGEYRMYYGGVQLLGTPTGIPRISTGLVTSRNGLDWTQRDKPVIAPGNPGEFDGLFAEAPGVIRNEDGTYLLFYSANDGRSYRIALATSTDGVNFQKRGVVVDVGQNEKDWDSKSASDAGVAKIGDVHHLYYSGFSFDKSQPKGIGLATSRDGITWTKQTVQAPLFSPDGVTDGMLRGPEGDEGTLQPFPRWNGKEVELYYANCPAPKTFPCHIYLATSKDGVSGWQKRGVVLQGGTEAYDSIGAIMPTIVEVPGSNRLEMFYGAIAKDRDPPQAIARATCPLGP